MKKRLANKNAQLFFFTILSVFALFSLAFIVRTKQVSFNSTNVTHPQAIKTSIQKDFIDNTFSLQVSITITPTPTLTPVDNENVEYTSFIEQTQATVPISAKTRVPILMYHYIRINPVPTDSIGYGLSVTPQNFALQMAYLARHSYHTLSMHDLGEAIAQHTNLPPNPIVLTFDDGYADFYENAFPILQKYHLRAENYIITGFVGNSNYLTWNMIQTMYHSGYIAFGSHTIDHPPLATTPLPNVVSELVTSKKVLESKLHTHITDFCYPYGSYNRQVEQAVKQAGYIDATTTQHGDFYDAIDMYAIPRIRVNGGESLQQFIVNLK